MPKRAPPLTATRVKALTSEGQAQRDVADGLVPGLGIRVSKTGRKTWVFSYRANGTRNRRMKLGTFPAMSLADARKRARDVLGEVEIGEDPAQDRADRRRGEYSFEAMVEEVVKREYEPLVANGEMRPGTFREYVRIIESELLPRWKDLPVANIARRDVRELADEIVDRGSPHMADATVRCLSALFNRALDRDFPTLDSNPAVRVKVAGAGGQRDRYLTLDEIRAVWKATSGEMPGVGWAFRIALLTGQRMGSVAAMRWDGIEWAGDEDSGLWTIPAEHFKGKRTHLVPLSPEASEVLQVVREAEGDEEWVFPARPPSRKPFLQAWNKSLARIRERTDIPHWTVHDFRRTFRTHATRAEEEGGLAVSGQVADAVLGHKEATLGFDRYTGDRARYLLHEKGEALTAWGQLIRGALERGADA